MSDFIFDESGTPTLVKATRSPSIAALAAALSKAQGEMEAASKASTNPHFKSKYADLASVWDACRGPLSKHGLSVLQPVSADGPSVTVTTILAHSSGEWISEALTMTAQQNTPQGVGSTITYGRRYGLSSMVGIAPDDDDGNAASGRPVAEVRVPDGYDDWYTNLIAVADNGFAKMQEMWTKSKPEYRDHLSTTNRAGLDALKAKATKVDAAAKAKADTENKPKVSA